VARGDADSDSDVDLLIVADDIQSTDLHGRLAQLHTDVRSWTGNDSILQRRSARPVDGLGALLRT
jgi:predicted nucleotidyltransferase